MSSLETDDTVVDWQAEDTAIDWHAEDTAIDWHAEDTTIDWHVWDTAIDPQAEVTPTDPQAEDTATDREAEDTSVGEESQETPSMTAWEHRFLNMRSRREERREARRQARREEREELRRQTIEDNFPLVRYVPAPKYPVAFNQAPSSDWLAEYTNSPTNSLAKTSPNHSMVIDGRIQICPPFALRNTTLLATFA